MESKSNQSSQGHWGHVDDDDDEQTLHLIFRPAAVVDFRLLACEAKVKRGVQGFSKWGLEKSVEKKEKILKFQY